MSAPPVYIDQRCYSLMLERRHQQHMEGKRGSAYDLGLFHYDSWLLNSAVIEVITLKRGHWHISLVFAHAQDPLRLIQRQITSCMSQRRAELTANMMRRQAAKDQRGTIKISEDNFSVCAN